MIKPYLKKENARIHANTMKHIKEENKKKKQNKSINVDSIGVSV